MFCNVSCRAGQLLISYTSGPIFAFKAAHIGRFGCFIGGDDGTHPLPTIFAQSFFAILPPGGKSILNLIGHPGNFHEIISRGVTRLDINIGNNEIRRIPRSPLIRGITHTQQTLLKNCKIVEINLDRHTSSYAITSRGALPTEMNSRKLLKEVSTTKGHP